MKHLKVFQVIVIANLLFLNILKGNTIIDIGELSREEHAPILEISITSSSSDITSLAKQAFNTHGGYKLIDNGGNIKLTLEPISTSEIALTLQSGSENKTQFTDKIKGANLNNAILMACDLVVKKTLGVPGFFAGKITFVGNRNGKSELFCSDLFFKHVRQLTHDKAHLLFPKWAPNGKEIIYTSYFKTGFPDIFIFNTITNGKKTVAAYTGTNIGGVFSPNGKEIAMILSSNGSPELYTANANGHCPKRLSKGKGLKAAPCWSPDGKKIYFSSDALGAPQIHVIDANGENMKRIPTNISRYCDEPTVNPLNSKELAFTAAVSGTFQICLFDFDNPQSRFITQGKEDHLEPCWLNDGRHLLVTYRNKGIQELHVIDSKTGKDTAIHSKDFGNASMSSFIYE